LNTVGALRAICEIWPLELLIGKRLVFEVAENVRKRAVVCSSGSFSLP